MKLLAVLLAASIGATTCGRAAAAPVVAPSATAAATRGASGTTTVTYCTDGGTPLLMDVSVPANTSAKAPAAMYVHGGGWEAGDRTNGAFLAQVRAALLAKGFVVASIDYRLAPANKWPAQIVDTKCAIRYLRANASTYGLDPDRIGLWGGSAGGHLVSLAGTADASAGFDVGEWPGVSSRVQAVVDLFGPADLTAGGWNQHPTSVIGEVFGVTPGTTGEVLTKASPVTWVTRDDPPFLILHGDADETVPAAQSQELARTLQAAGVPATLVMVKGGPHGLANPKESPSPTELVAQIVAFFTKTLVS